jgi:Zn-dependent peptidase ImmA (M78 family)
LDYGEFRCTWIEPRALWTLADETRNKFWPESILPVNMEEIVEFRLGLNIEPVKYLQSTIDVDAYLKRDLSGIVVDYDWYMDDKFANRMRFSFAHELGHFFLHEDLYTNFGIRSPEEWKDFLLYVPENEYRNFEWQANEFAGRLLVPRQELEAKMENVGDVLKENNLIPFLKKDPDAVLSRISTMLSKPFGVSTEVIEKRVKRERLWPPGI